MTEDRKTQVRPQEDRTLYLREALAGVTTEDDLIPLVREMARVLVAINAEVVKLPEVSNNLARLEKLWLTYMEDQLGFRQQREEAELKRAQQLADQAAKDLNLTSQKMKAIKLTGRTGVAVSQLPAKFSWTEWFRDRCLPYLVNGFIITIASLLGIALWQYFKSQVGVP